MYNSKDLWKEVELSQEKMHEAISKKGANSPEAKRAILAFRSKMQDYESVKREP
jgi:hypothetical protein